MMSTTHAAMGVAVAAATLRLAPELAAVAALAAIGGGLFPDLDAFVGTHRRTLHFPVYYWVGAVPALALAAIAPGPTSVAIAFFLLSAALHSASDVLGASSDFRPWERRSDDAVYLHVSKRWLTARRIVRYDGSPEDFALTLVLSLPGALLFDGVVRSTVIALIVAGGLYTLFRRRIPTYLDRFVE